MADHERRLRSLALNGEADLSSILGARLDSGELEGLDAKTGALVRLGAVVVVGSPPATYQWATQLALDAGATDEEIVGTLVAVTPISGLTRAVAAAPELAVALGHDVDEALERVSNRRSRDD